MPTVRTLARSFAGGEIAPELYGRMDLDKYQTGLARCRNFVVQPHGPVQNRPGFAYVNAVRDSSRRTRLIPFSFSASETMVLEFGHHYIRFHTNGGTLLELAKAIGSIVGNTVNLVGHGYATSDWVYIGSRFLIVASVPTANAFTVSDLFGNPVTPVGSTAARAYEVASDYAEADLFDLHYVQSADVLTITHPSYPPRELRRIGATNWQLQTISFSPLLDPPQDLGVRATGSGNVLYRYRVTAKLQNGLEESLASEPALGTLRYAVSSVQTYRELRISAVTQATEGVFSTLVAHGLFNGIQVYIAGMADHGMVELPDGWYKVKSAPTATTFTLWTEDDVVVDTSTYSAFVDSAPYATVQRCLQLTLTSNPAFVRDDAIYAENFSTLGIIFDDTLFRVGLPYSSYPNVVTLKSESFGRVEGMSSADTSTPQTGLVTLQGARNNLATAGNKNVLRWSPVANAGSYCVYKDQNGIFGYIGQSVAPSFVDDNILPDTLRTPPELAKPFEEAGSYPSTVSYFDQRRCFAATDKAPQTLWMSKAGTESNLSSSVPVQDDDAIVFRIAAREQNRIRHLVPLSDLIMLTAGGEWRVFTGSGDPVTPSTVVARPQSYVGANNVQPVTTSLSAIYISAQGSLFRELVYSADGLGSYRSEDLSVLSPHLVRNRMFSDLAFSRAPLPLAWATRDDGKLLGLTYLPEQSVRAWHAHDTVNGQFESVCCVAENNEDVVYAVVHRQIDGQDMRYIERMSMTPFIDQTDAFFVDSGLTYSGAATMTITGLWHLEGQEVAILGDGAVFPRQTVSGGSITLDHAVSKAQIGLPIESDLQTLPVTLEAAPALGVGYLKNISKAFMRVYRSSGIFVGPSFEQLTEFKMRTTEPYGAPPNLRTEEIELPMTTTWQRDGSVCIRQTAPLPLTIQTLSLEVSVGG